MDRLLPLPEALAVNSFALDRSGQVGYLVECVLGGLHGLAVGDLIEEIAIGSELGSEVTQRLAATMPRERDLFMAATSLDDARYLRAFDGLAEVRLKDWFAQAGQV
jgi:hypothetical protein